MKSSKGDQNGLTTFRPILSAVGTLPKFSKTFTTILILFTFHLTKQLIFD